MWPLRKRFLLPAGLKGREKNRMRFDKPRVCSTAPRELSAVCLIMSPHDDDQCRPHREDRARDAWIVEGAVDGEKLPGKVGHRVDNRRQESAVALLKWIDGVS